jgi:hypothetical protein
MFFQVGGADLAELRLGVDKRGDYVAAFQREDMRVQARFTGVTVPRRVSSQNGFSQVSLCCAGLCASAH